MNTVKAIGICCLQAWTIMLLVALLLAGTIGACIGLWIFWQTAKAFFTL